jgi:hypothetical protein
MAKRYEIQTAISREKALELLNNLKDPDFRARFEESPRTILFEYRIDVAPDTLPETVKIPDDPEKIEALINAAESLLPENASPFGLLALFVVFGAMPMVTSGDSAN